MRKISLFSMGVLLLGSQPFLHAQSNLYEHFKSTTSKEFLIGEVKKITFNAGNLEVLLKNGTNNSDPIHTIEYLSFSPKPITTIVEEEEQMFSNVHISPNPIQGDILNVFLNKMHKGLLTVQLIDIHGIVEVELTKNLLQEGLETFLPVAHLKSGIYLCKLTMADKVLTTKLIKY